MTAYSMSPRRGARRTWRQLAADCAPHRFLARIHQDDRGALGVLLLLVIWGLVALLGLLWNLGEFGTRQQHVQVAADTTAHAAATWNSRATNLVTSDNLLICQNASSEIVYRSVDPTHQYLQTLFNNEIARGNQLLKGKTANTPETNPLDIEYFDEFLGTGSFSGQGRMVTAQAQLTTDLQKLEPDLLKAAGMVNYQPQKDVTEAIRRNKVALAWLLNTYILGGAGTPSAPVAGGVRAALIPWVNDVRSRIKTVLATIPSEQAILDQFVAHTDPGLVAVSPATLAQRRSDIFDRQKRTVAAIPSTIDMTRSTFAGQYKTNITLATPSGAGATETTSAIITPPVQTADIPEGTTHLDSIRQQYPLEALGKFGTSNPIVTLDPINCNVTADGGNADGMLWHPDPTIPMPTGYSVNGVPLTGQFKIDARESDLDRGWGFIYCAPLARYVNDRISRDEAGLQTQYMQPIDDIRAALYAKVYPIPAPPYVAVMPSIPDPTAVVTNGIPDPMPIPIPPQQGASQSSLRQRGLKWPPPPMGALGQQPPKIVPVATPLPNLPVPNTLSAADRQFVQSVNTRSQAFNNAMIAYCQELKQLDGRVNGFTNAVNGYFSHTSNPGWSNPGAANGTAVGAWQNFVEVNRALVLRELGTSKQFMIFPTYQLRDIPNWARDSQQASARQYVFETVYNRNIGPVRTAVVHQIARILVKAMATDPNYTAYLMSLGYTQGEAQGWQGSQNWAAALVRAGQIDNQFGISDQVVRAGANIISTEVAAEWVTRPWPYEIEPPAQTAPPNPGIRTQDRWAYLTLLAAAKGTPDNNVPLFLPKLFPDASKPVVAYAQAETFNWMEYHPAYGAGENYDVLNNLGHGSWSSAPGPWRISTQGGWNWQPRLSFSDALVPALDNNPQFGTFFNDTGVIGHDASAINQLNLH